MSDYSNSITITVPQKKLPVLATVDVCVIGGGTAGISAAVSAARNGSKTMLIERWPFLGGTTTGAMVCMWHLSDGKKQVIKGIAQELVDQYIKLDSKTMKITPNYPELGDPTDKSHEFSPEIIKHVFDRYVQNAGVIPLYYTNVSDVIMDGDSIKGVIVSTKQGQMVVCSKYFVDCTGDGDIAYFAGGIWEYGRKTDSLVQGMTMIFELGNIDKQRAKSLTPDSEESKAILKIMADKRDRGELPNFGPIDFSYYADGGFANMNPASGNPCDNLELTANTIKSRQNIFKFLDFYRLNVKGYENARIVQSGASIGIRESRRIMGEYIFSVDDVIGERRFKDGIGHGFWCIDIHDPKGSGSTTWENKSNTKYWLGAGHNYQIPFGIMIPQKIENLLVAGRCVSATHEGIASLRLQSHCMVMGQAAGTALSECIRTDKPIRSLDMNALREKLVTQGAYIEM